MPTKEEIMDKLSEVVDPELFINIVDLGLVYDAEYIEDEKKVEIEATLTSPGCPLAGMIEGEIRKFVSQLDGVETIDVNIVFDPPWNPSMMTDEAKLTLGYDI